MERAAPVGMGTTVVGVIGIIVMLPIALNRTAAVSDPSDLTSGTLSVQESPPTGAGGATPTGTVGPTPNGTADTARILAISDSYTGGPARGGRGEAGWPPVLEQRMTDTDVEVVAAEDAGYVTTAGEQTLSDLVTGADLTDVDLVVLFGSRFDVAGIADRVGAAAEQAITSITERRRRSRSSSSGRRGPATLHRQASATTGTSSAPRPRCPTCPSSTAWRGLASRTLQVSSPRTASTSPTRATPIWPTGSRRSSRRRSRPRG